MRADADAFAGLADVSLALMGQEISDADRDAFHEELRRHTEALALIGVGQAASGCRFTRVYVSCPSTATVERVTPTSGVTGEDASAERAQGSPTVAARTPIRWGPVRWGGGSCVSIPGTSCFLCYEYECSR